MASVGALRRLRKWRSYVLVVVGAYAFTLLIGALAAPLRGSLENIVFDQYQRWKPRPSDLDEPVRIVDIDDESIHLIGRWPWSRRKMADLVEALVKANVAGIGFDFVFSEPDETGGDAAACAAGGRGPDQASRCAEGVSGDTALAHAVQGRPVALGVYLTATHDGAQASLTSKAGFSYVGDPPADFVYTFKGVLPPIGALRDAAAGLGFLNWLPDNDRVVRRVPLLLNVNGQLQPSLALETLRVAQGASGYVVKSTTAAGSTAGKSEVIDSIKDGDVVVPVQADGLLRVWFAKSDPRRVVPAWKALQPDADLSDLSGKLVLIGASASLLSDIVATPLDPSTPGVEAHANLIGQMLAGATLERPDWAPGAEIWAGAALSLLLAVLLPLFPIYATAVMLVVAAGGFAVLSWTAFAHQGVLIDPVTPGVTAGFVFLAGVGQLYGQKRQQVSEIRSAFGRYVSPAVVARLAEHPEQLKLGGEKRDLTVMFCDIRSFTTLSEGFTAVELSTFLNEYLSPMTDIILGEEGTVDKYMGDAIMAFWNAPLDDAAHGIHGVRAALRMRETLAELNRDWRESAAKADRPFKPVKFGIGLNTGECSVGNMGSLQRFDYSALGDEVNIASRLEGSSKQFGVDIVASAATRDEAAEFAWLEIDRVKLKNKTRAVALFALAGGPAYAESDDFRRLAALHEDMLAAYRARKFAAAQTLAQEAAPLAPAEVAGLYGYCLRRFAALDAQALPESWAPMIALDEK
ncbi:adenylate cyclase [Roseiarcus fermentans]|uniref:Adenylate cyclase n=1 Tax=Roseiarcus fermentans TaxID=1473586 RepID=A0A366F9W1_9HYPH|nr:adenylate/guanylate cyclase domain-containing protein [Roseiarcus fermentans]RBP11398.1 adenylate cyclase [Roseiarcus fermentans]